MNNQQAAEQFAEKYYLALDSASKADPQRGICGFELEWNLLDHEFRPLLTVGSGPNQQSFVDYLRAEHLSPWSRTFSQLEVFHWMIEWATRPYYSPRGAVYEGRLMEATLINALHRAGNEFAERLFCWHGNLLVKTLIGHYSIPGTWHLAKRRYLERCVDLYGDSLATTGTHTNLSLPESLLAWDFMHLPGAERGNTHLDEFKSEFYITATRLMRAFAALFIATSASTPFQPKVKEGKSSVVLTQFDSVRNLTFPNPVGLDLPNLYRSYQDYLEISYDLVRRGIRFGNNNWTPVRARSFAEPVERLIHITSDQLEDLYARGLYSLGKENSAGEMARQIEIQNLLARINLPMARVEIRTDDEGLPIELDIANLTLKYLLLLKFYYDPAFGRAFRYDQEDIARARRNEYEAASRGLRAEIEHPLSGKPVAMREFLSWVLNEIGPLAETLSYANDLQPLQEMSAGGPNTAERMRQRVREMLGAQAEDGELEIPLEILESLAIEREESVANDVEMIAAEIPAMKMDENKLSEFVQHMREEVRLDPQAPIRFRPKPNTVIEIAYPDKSSEILDLAQSLIRIPSVTACPEERLEEVHRAATFIYDYARNYKLEVRFYEHAKYPALLIGFPGEMAAPVMLSGHFDVVQPEPDDSQFEPRIDADYLWGRGAADMKTVVATNLVWLKDALRNGPPYPHINLVLVGNEENGETEAMGTPHVLRALSEDADGLGYSPQLFIAGERTGERGSEIWGEICTENRGIMRFELIVKGQRGHSGIKQAAGKPVSDLGERLLRARIELGELFSKYLTLSAADSWKSQVNYPFIQVGRPGIYNITPDQGVLGVEIRPIPEDDLNALVSELEGYCQANELEINIPVCENGIVCSPDNPYLQGLIKAVTTVSGSPPVLGRKLPGTSARFAPGGQGIVWGQTGIGPHAAEERHYIPSIMPYYQALSAYSTLLNEQTDVLVDKSIGE